MAVPEGWMEATVADVASVTMGNAPSSEDVHDGLEGPGLPFVQGNAEFGCRHPSPIKRCTRPTRVAERGDVLLSVRAPVGELNIAAATLAIGRGLAALRFTAMEPEFGWHAMAGAAPLLARVSQGSTFVAVNRGDIETLRLPLPPLPEQRKIAAILSSVDETIEKTEAVIDQLQVVKKAMMEELLTRGMPGRHARFKQTEIGEVPEGWEVCSLSSVCRQGPQNGLYKSAEFYGDGTPMLDMGDLFRSHIVQDGDRRRVRLSSVELDRFRLRAGDLVFARRSLVPEGAGQCARVPELREYPVFESSIIRFSPDPSRCSSSFMAHFWNGSPGQALRMKIVRVVAVSGVTGADLGALPMPLPPVAEQCEIADVIDQLDLQLQKEAVVVDAAQRVKTALSAALLSGDLRVAPDEASP